ncbi:MAG: hypothetical protein NVSMB18_18270 [Acetobacteraceae bacterium]
MLLAGLAVLGLLPTTRARGLLDLFADPARARGLGEAYLALLNQRPSPAALTDAVWGDLAGSGPLRTRVADQIRRDYASGRITCLDGWLLSVTEARLCALAALATGAGDETHTTKAASSASSRSRPSAVAVSRPSA